MGPGQCRSNPSIASTRLDVPGTRAVVFSGVTRNFLVILSLVLALPAGFELAPLAVTRTLVELLIMVLFVLPIPRIVGGAPDHLPQPGG